MHHIAMLDDLGFSPFPVPNSKPQTRNPKLVFTPSFTDNELSALIDVSKDHKKSIKFSPKTRSQTEQIAPEEIAIEDFFLEAWSLDRLNATNSRPLGIP